MKKIFILLFVVLSIQSYAQYSEIDQFVSPTGTNTIIRTDYSRTRFVTYCRSTGLNRYFIVKTPNATKYFNLMEYYENISEPLASIYRYEINDVQIMGQTCYFCGYRWRQTDEIIYYIDGSWGYVVEYDGLIGRFDIEDDMDNGGNYELMIIDSTHSLNKLAVHSGGLIATATLNDGQTPCLVELREITYWDLSVDYNYRVIVSSNSDEYFSDVTATWNKYVVASRYSNPTNANAYNYLFGLRYGNGDYFYGTNSAIYNYSTQNVLPNEGASFISMEPLHITSTALNDLQEDEVVVAYINRKASNRCGFPIMYKFNSQGQASSKILIGLDNRTYTSIKEIKYNRPLYSTSRMAMLLEDSEGYSDLRFPRWAISDSENDTILTSSIYKLNSIAPFQYTSGSLELLVSGNTTFGKNKVINLLEGDIHGYHGNWSNKSCIGTRIGEWEEITSNVSPAEVTSSLQSYYYKSHILFDTYGFTLRNASSTKICENY